jgi:hypothetical protein
VRATADLKHSVRAEVERHGQDFDALLDDAGAALPATLPSPGEARLCSWCGGWEDGWTLPPAPHVLRCECAWGPDD